MFRYIRKRKEFKDLIFTMLMLKYGYHITLIEREILSVWMNKGNSSTPLFKSHRLILLVLMLLDYRTGRILGNRLSTRWDSGPVVMNKRNIRLLLFKINKSILLVCMLLYEFPFLSFTLEFGNFFFNSFLWNNEKLCNLKKKVL